MDDLIDIFDKVADCEYKGEHYSARDNGAVMRHPKTPNRPRPTGSSNCRDCLPRAA